MEDNGIKLKIHERGRNSRPADRLKRANAEVNRDKTYFFLCNKKLFELSKIRTFILDLHEAIRLTSNSFFKQIQCLKNNI